MSNLINKKGFALLYSILITGAVLVIGVILMNIITKQLIFSSVSRNSETSYYYAANSGRECLDYYAGRNPVNFYRKRKVNGVLTVIYNDTVNLSCFGQPFVMEGSVSQSGPDKRSYSLTSGSLSLDGNKVELYVTFNSNCILGNLRCQGENLEDKSIAVMKAVGYSGASGRGTKRVAILVKQP